MNIIDFAKAAGVSTATISRAFHEPDKVRPQTRDRILDLAAKLRYYPDPSGRALVTGRHDALGVVWPLEVEGTDAPFAQRILAALTQVLVRLDLDLLICPVDRRVPATMAHARRTLMRSRCDAWVLLYPRRDDEELLTSLGSSRKPVVCLMGSVPARPDWRCVELNQQGWMEDALRRLSQTGARHPMFIGQRPREQDHAERAQAFQRLAPQQFSNWSCRPIWPATPETIAPLLAADSSPDAVIAVDDSVALATLSACRTLGISVPHQIQIIGMDDTPEARAASPSIATFRQPLAAMATAAVELAMGKLDMTAPFEAEFILGSSLRHRRES